jgi:hypothetical protein
MDIYNVAFYVTSYLAVPIWGLMILFPRARFTQVLLGSVWIVVPFLIPYSLLILWHLGDIPLFLRPTPEKIQTITSQHYGVVMAWIHFIPMDLFAGRWIYLDSRRRALNTLVMAPILVACFLTPPLGVLIYILYAFTFGKPLAPSDAHP